MTWRPDFIAGNTRLRARLSAMLDASDYERLTDSSLDAAVDSLGATAYRPHLDRCRAEDREVLDAVTERLRVLLRGVRGVYGGAAGEVVSILLARHDLADTLALLRGGRTGQPAGERLAAVMAVGAVDEQAAAEVADAVDGATAMTRLAAHRLPDPATARVLPAAWDRFELTADPNELETSIAASAVHQWISALTRSGKAARPVLELVKAECDRANLLAVLRDPADDAPRQLPAGRLDPAALLAARKSGVTGLVAVRPEWRQALDRYTRDGDLVELEWNLDVAIWRGAVRRLRLGDPLGADVPVGYALAAECEARNVRLLLLAARRGPVTDVRPLLVA